MIPTIPAPIIVKDENPGDGWVAGCAGDSVVFRATGVWTTVVTAGVV
jgi:hypothetical protein